MHLLQRVASPEDARTALKAVEKFHLARAHAGWLTGLGNQVSNLVATMCCAHGEWRAALDAFVRAPRVGLRHTHRAHTALLQAAGTDGGPDGVLTAYRALRGTGHLRVSNTVAHIVMRALRGPHPSGGASPRRAYDAGVAFAREGIPPRQDTWLDLMCAAAWAPDASVVRDCLKWVCPDGQPPSAVAHFALSLAAVLEGDAQAAQAAAAQAAKVAQGAKEREQLGAMLATWAQHLPQGLAVPGGCDGVLERVREAAASAGVAVDGAVEGALREKSLTDGPCGGAAPAK